VISADDDNIDLTIKPHTTLVGYDADSGSMFATMCSSKGKSDKYALGAARNWVRSLGLTSGTLAGDGEPALQDFLKEVARGVEIPLQVRTSPVADPQSNGAAENAVGCLKRQVRVLCAQLDVSYELRLGPRHWLFAWAVRHAAWCISRFVGRGPSRRSGYSLRHGVAYSGQMLPFGETCIGREISIDE
jgi:hypothetical protein